MGLLDAVKDQFLDVIEYVDQSNKLIVSKYQRESGNNELKQGSKVIVRESQNAVFLKGGKLADILPPGTYSLTTDNFPVLSSLKAFPYLFVSPVIADVYFVSTRQFIDNKWATKNPIMKRDKDFNIVLLPFMLLAMYEKNGQPLEKIVRNIVQVCFLRPKERPYRTNNFYAALERQENLDKEVYRIVRKAKTHQGGKEANRSRHRKSEKSRYQRR